MPAAINGSASNAQPGEIALVSAAGAVVRLAADGSIYMQGNVNIQGNLVVSGDISDKNAVHSTLDVLRSGLQPARPRRRAARRRQHRWHEQADAVMADLAHYFGQDLSLGPTGDLALVSGSLAVEQRVLRRLLTAPGAYIWHVPYGAGLGALVGMPANARLITGLVRQQMGLEAAVAQNPAADRLRHGLARRHRGCEHRLR